MNLDAFTVAYVRCALWSSVDDDGNPLDEHPGELSTDALDAMRVDCEAFARAHGDSIPEERSFDAGHDFWLTRNRHGAGFWDGDWPEPLATTLTDAADAYGECDLYIADDGQIEVS